MEEREQNTTRDLKDELPKGMNWKWEELKTLNRLRTGIGRCYILGEEDNTNCKCGETQTMGNVQ